MKHSTTNLNVHSNLGVSNRIYPSYSRGYGGYGGYGGYAGLYGGFGYGGLGFGGLGYGGYGNGGAVFVENDQFNNIPDGHDSIWSEISNITKYYALFHKNAQ